jgi:glycerol-3-phosphate dehydrogenase (NAD(P)+)
MSVAEVSASTRQVAEGVKTCRSLCELSARYGVEMPIVEAVTTVVEGEMTPKQMLSAMMSRAARSER